MRIRKKIADKQKNINSAEPVTIVCLGDSVTQGCFECYVKEPGVIETVFDYESSYSTRLRQMLNTLYPSVQFNIINSGISGDNACGGVSRLERDVLKYSPDLVVVGFALNDSSGGQDGLERYKTSLEKIVSAVKDSGAECIILTPNMMNTAVSYQLKDKELIDAARYFAEIQNEGFLDSYVETAKAVAEAMNVPVCDIYAKWKKMAAAGVNITEMLANKLNHPIRPLHNMIASMLLDMLLD